MKEARRTLPGLLRTAVALLRPHPIRFWGMGGHPPYPPPEALRPLDSRLPVVPTPLPK